jgi:hypothetical protein
MWELILGIVSKLLGIFQPKSETQTAHDEGEKLGQAETGKKTDDEIIKEVGEANDARQSVRDAPASELRSDDGFRRD